MRFWLVGWMIAVTVKWEEEMDGERCSRRRKADAESGVRTDGGEVCKHRKRINNLLWPQRLLVPYMVLNR